MNTLRIAIACFLGAFLGSMVALQFGPELWWLGSIAGAAIGYTTYRFEDIIAAIPVAGREVISWRWQPNRPWWQAYFGTIVDFGNGGMIMGSIAAILLMPIVGKDYEISMLFWAPIFWGGFVVLVVAFLALGDSTEQLQKKRMHTPNLFRFWFWSLPRGVIRFVRGTLHYAGQFVSFMIMAIGTLSPLCWQLIKTVFHIIHSELRLLCAADAALGAAIGYFAGNALVGGIAGSLLGILNYEIVSVRMLKLAEAKSIFHR